MRSKTEIRSRRKRNFVDPSLAAAALFASSDDLINDMRTFGFIFESLVLRDLQIYLQHLDGEVFYYRDSNDFECDAILHLRTGQWAAVEVKLGSQAAVEEGVANLQHLREIVDTHQMREPSFLMVITGATQYAIRDKSGVFVAPIGCLRP